MKTLYEMLQDGSQSLKAAGITEYETDAWYLLSYVTGISRTQYLCDRTHAVNVEHKKRYLELIAKRAERIPLQQLTGEQEFMGLTFRVNEHVLIPRQDTEILVEEAGKLLKRMENARVLDLCTGSGCIIVSLMVRYGAARAVGADISREALKVAEWNAKQHHTKVSLVQSDLFAGIEGKFDLIVSNPPYIRTSVIETLEPEVKEHEPVLALDGKEDGLYFYRNILKQAGNFLTAGGYLLFEIGYDQGREVLEMMKLSGYTEVRVVKDLAGLDRVCIGKYMEE